MKIKVRRKDRGDEIVDIFGIYWDKRANTLFLGIPNDNIGVFGYSADEVEIIDPNINFRTVYFTDNRLPAILHWALVEKNLLDEVVNGNIELKEEFLEIVRSENVIDW